MSTENQNKQETIADILREIRQGMDPNSTVECQYLESDICNLADRIEAAAKRERESLIREEVENNYHPNDWRVYVIEDSVLGFFAGFTNRGSPTDVPMFCVTIDGALKYDAFRDLAARERVVAIRNHYVPNAKVWAYKRHEIFPEQYRKEDKNVK